MFLQVGLDAGEHLGRFLGVEVLVVAFFDAVLMQLVVARWRDAMACQRTLDAHQGAAIQRDALLLQQQHAAAAAPPAVLTAAAAAAAGAAGIKPLVCFMGFTNEEVVQYKQPMLARLGAVAGIKLSTK